MRILLDPVIASPILIFGGRQLRDILLCKIWVSNKGVHVPRVSAWWSPTLIIWFWKFKYFGKKSKGIWKYTSTYVHINMNLGNWEKRNKMYTTLMTGDPQFFVQSCKQANPMLCFINVQWLSITAIWSSTFWPSMLCSEQLRALKLLSSYEKKYNETPLEVPTLFNFHLNCTTTSQGDSCLMSHNSGSTHEEGVGCIWWQQF